MMLSRFIREHMQEILTDWEAFARTLTPAAQVMSLEDLRDHAELMLKDIARDIETAQSTQQQEDKSKDMASPAKATESAASQHGAGRHASDFTLLQLTAEYRALRASVLRLWLPYVRQMDDNTVNQLMRFNEAVDQALAESVVAFSNRTEYTRDLFLAILGHDLRTPLSTITLAGDLFARPNLEQKKAAQVGANVKRSAIFMSSMVENLLGYARKHLGSGIPLKCEPIDLRDMCQAAIDAASVLHPDHRFGTDLGAELTGTLDRVRVQQLLNNLLCNAGQYGQKESPVTLAVHAEADDIVVKVHNYGPAIPAASLACIFAPLIQLPVNETDVRPRTSLGLGLYIAREIAEAHGGTIAVTSNDADGTTFIVRLPRKAKASASAAGG
ncbi:HAMP domain-containing histidine kinase [Oxalobacteraceae bacterium OM1]|nr:HAMP domain-containing histidine kinase [Oxalobacteraceae bacterium OM1]